MTGSAAFSRVAEPQHGQADRPGPTLRGMRGRVGALVALLVVALAAPTAPARAAVAPTERASLATWAGSAALPSGALATYPDRTRVVPYLGSFAAWGLADQARRSRDRLALETAWAHLRWYAAAQDGSGYVTDWTVGADGSLTSTGSMDSTDSYAALFLLAADAAWSASRTVEGTTAARARLTALRAGLDGALRAVESTVDADGLTWAAPTWRVKYLMDQAEVLAGMQAADRLFAALGDQARSRRAATVAAGVDRGVARLWDPVSATYAWAKHESGAREAADLRVLYPDAMEQLWAVAFGLVPRKVAPGLVQRIAALHPELADPTATALMGWGTDVAGYWPMAAVAFLEVGDRAGADRVLTGVDTAATAAGRAWPFSSADAGQLLLAHGMLLDG
jgi:hypothetical protein